MCSSDLGVGVAHCSRTIDVAVACGVGEEFEDLLGGRRDEALDGSDVRIAGGDIGHDLFNRVTPLSIPEMSDFGRCP